MIRSAILLVVLVCSACIPASGESPRPTESWIRSTPAEQSLDGERLDNLVAALRKNEIRNIHSLLIVRNGRLVLEEYFNGHGAEELHEQQSVSKSFTSALVGIAISQGKIEGVDERALAFFPEIDDIENLDERKREITLEDLLTMRSGTDYHERGSDSPHFQLNRLSRGWTKFILDRPMIAEPGTSFRYDSGAVILTSAILKERTGMHADAFAEKYLFAPMGIEQSRWYRNAEGHPHTGGGLHLRSKDMAKLGLLYLQKGRWDGKQILPTSWVADSLSRQVELEGQRDRVVGYGYWWWVLPPAPGGSGTQDVYGAFGFKGQYIFVAPELDMVVVVTAGARGRQEQNAPIEFLYTHIFDAVR